MTHRAYYGRFGLSTALIAWLASIPAMAGQWHATPELEVAETYTDNVDLNATGTGRKTDFITRISPGVQVTGKSGRTTLDLTYRLNYLIFARSDEDTDLRHFLDARGHSELIEDFFFLDLGGSVNQQFLDRGGAVSGNQDNATDNRRTVQNYNISPYIRRPLGTLATATARYRLSYVDVSGQASNNPLLDVLSETVSHHGIVQLDSGPSFTRLGWSLSGSYTRDDRTQGRRDSERAIGRAEARYTVSQMLTLLGSVGYEEITDTSLLNDRDGVTWDAGVTLKPGPRTVLTVRGGERYNEMNWSVVLNYKVSNRTRLRAGYTEEITTTLRILQDELSGGEPGGPVVDPGGFSLVDSAFKRNRVYGGVNGSRGRTTFSLDGFYEERRFDIATTPPENRYGGHGVISRRLSPRLTANIGGNYEKTEVKGLAAREDDFYGAHAGLNYSFSQYISGGVTYYFTSRESDEASRDLKENAVKINIRATF
jgi:hypothetical protein